MPDLRIVLAEATPGQWRLYRQPQWIGAVRADPGLAARPRHHYDLDEAAYLDCLDAFKRGAGDSLDEARGCLTRHGAVEVAPPGG